MITQSDFDNSEEPIIMLSNGFYDFLKAFVMVVSPSACIIYLSLSTVFELPFTPELVILVLAVTLFLSLFLFASTKQYKNADFRYDGKMLVTQNEEGELLYSLELNDDPAMLRLKAHISFRVVNLDEPLN